MIEHVVFDFFGTLVTYADGIAGNPCERALTELGTRGIVLDAAEFQRRFSDCFAVLEAEAERSLREYSMDDAARLLFQDLGVAPQPGAIRALVGAYLTDWNAGVVGLPRLEPWLRSLPVGKSVLTNTHQTGFVPAHLDRLGIAHHVEHVTSSVDHGRRKPDPSIYRDHLQVLGLGPGQVVLVGDNAVCDYHGPRAAGIESYLISPRPVPGVDDHHRLAHLYQLADRLGSAGRLGAAIW